MSEDINTKICEFIKTEWIEPFIANGGSQIEFADKHNILESTVRKIKGETPYRIPVETLHRMCLERGILLSDFFKLFEKMYP